jgi:hypothetical protein
LSNDRFKNEGVEPTLSIHRVIFLWSVPSSVFRGCQRNTKWHLFCIIFRLRVLVKIQDTGWIKFKKRSVGHPWSESYRMM